MMLASVRAFGRLVWRPGVLPYLYILGLTAAAPTIFDGTGWGRNSHSIHVILWEEALILMPVLGAILTSFAAVFLTKPLAVTTPSAFRRIVLGKQLYGVLAVFALSVAIAVTESPAQLPSALAICAFGFLVGCAVPDAAANRTLTLGANLVVLIIVIRPDAAVSMIDRNRVVVSLLAAGAAVVLAIRDFSPTVARARVLTAERKGSNQKPWFFERNSLRADKSWSVVSGLPASHGLRTWLRRIDYEYSGGRRFGSAGQICVFLLIACAAAYLVSGPALPSVLGLMALYPAGTLAGRWPYPIDRTSRAHLTFVYGILRYSGYFIAAMLLTWAVFQLNLPAFPLFAAEPRDLTTFVFLPAMFAWTPLVQWLSLKWRIQRVTRSSQGYQYKTAGLLLIAIPLAAVTSVFVKRIVGPGFGNQLGFFVALTLATHVWLWFATKSYFRTADLVGPSVF